MGDRERRQENFIPAGSAELLMRRIIASELADGAMSETKAQQMLSRIKDLPGELAEFEGALKLLLMVGLSEEDKKTLEDG